jgi:hypothetical protein
MPVARRLAVNLRLASCLAACVLLAAGRPASAVPALVGAAQPTELRVALAQTPELTTVWTSVRLDGAPGPFAIVVPLPAGAFVDQSSDAWFEALEVATATRVFPPEGLSPFCPGESGPPSPFEIAADVTHQASLAPETFTLADDAAAVATWASEQGLPVSPDLEGAFGAVPAAKFLCVRFTTPGGPALTPTLRVTAPIGLPSLPFSITRAGSSDMRVSAWLLGDGRGALSDTAATSVPPSAIVWNAEQQATNYAAWRDDTLAAEPDSIVLEAAGHDALVAPTPIANGAATIEALMPTYFARASEYGNGSSDPAPCTSAAKATLDASQPVGPACPRGDLAALAGDCAPQPPGAGEIDPATLLCGPGADDLAVALSGAVPADTQLTRRTFVLAAGSSGKDRTVTFPAGASKVPLFETLSVDVSDCFGGAGGSGGSGGSTGTTSSTGSGASGSTSSGSGGAPTGSGNGANGNAGQGGTDDDLDPSVYVDTGGCACTGPIDTSDTIETYETDTDESTDTGGDDCGGDSSSSSSDSGGDDCGGDSSSSSDTGGDDCGGDSSSSSGDDCGGDSGSSSSWDGISSDSDDSGGPGDSGDSGASNGISGDPGSSVSSNCAVTQHRPTARRKVGVRLSALTLGVAVLLLPLRRRGTRKRRRTVVREPHCGTRLPA